MAELTPTQIYHRLEELLLNAKCRLSLPMRALAINDGGVIDFNLEERTGMFDAMSIVIKDLEALCCQDNSDDPFAVDLKQNKSHESLFLG